MVVVAPLAEDIFTKMLVSLCDFVTVCGYEKGLWVELRKFTNTRR